MRRALITLFVLAVASGFGLTIGLWATQGTAP